MSTLFVRRTNALFGHPNQRLMTPLQNLVQAAFCTASAAPDAQLRAGSAILPAPLSSGFGPASAGDTLLFFGWITARTRAGGVVGVILGHGLAWGALALALGIRLGKPGVYTLNAAGLAPGSQDTARACALAGRALGLMVLGALILILAQWWLPAASWLSGLWPASGGGHG